MAPLPCFATVSSVSTLLDNNPKALQCLFFNKHVSRYTIRVDLRDAGGTIMDLGAHLNVNEVQNQ
jgi:hypothetical protein